MSNHITPSEKIALRPREAADMLSISERTLWKWTQAGLIPCMKVGKGKTNAVLYSVDVLKAFVTKMLQNNQDEKEV